MNADQKKALLPKIDAHYGDIKGKTVAMWGLAFKPNTDDIREAPALEMIDALLQRGAKVQCYDPEAMPNVQRILGDSVVFSEKMYSALEGADFLVIATEWPEFRTLTLVVSMGCWQKKLSSTDAMFSKWIPCVSTDILTIASVVRTSNEQRKSFSNRRCRLLGSHLCERFLKEGYHVIGMDNLITGDLRNIEHLFPLESFEFHNHDVSQFVHVAGDLKYILHFASPASPIDYLKIPIQTLKVGSLGTHNLLGLAMAKKARILVASTSEVYGDPTVHPQTEEYWGNVNPVGPRGVYDEAKRFQEAITMAYHTFHGLETRIVRIFNTYGPRMRLNDGRVLPAFMGQALRGEDLTVFGDGSQTRSFCYVDDLVEGIYRLLLSDCADPVNVGNPHEITIGQFAEEIIKLTETDQKVIYKPLPTDDPKQRQPDITKAKALLNWGPKVDRAEGLRITWDYFKSLPRERLYEESHHRDFVKTRN